jgi:hypothetical protein
MADFYYSLLPATVGEDYNINIQLVDSVAGNAISLAGYSGDLQVRTAIGSPIVLEASTANGLMILNSPTGNVNIKFGNAAITTAGNYLFELKLTDPNGIVSKPLWGPFVIQGTITP